MSTTLPSSSRHARVTGHVRAARATASAFLAAIAVIAGCARDEMAMSTQFASGTDASEAGRLTLEIVHDTWIKDSPSSRGTNPRADEMCLVFEGSKLTASAQGTDASGHRELRGVAVERLVDAAPARDRPGGSVDATESADASPDHVPSHFRCSAAFLASRAGKGVYVYSPHVRILRPGGAQAPFSGEFYWPVPLDTALSSTYGMRGGRMHRGLDLAARTGTPIRASATGRVIGRRNSATVGSEGKGPWGMSGTVASGFRFSNYGNVVLLDHGFAEGSPRPVDFYSLYAHQKRVTVAEGDEVEAGDLLGEMGNTGSSTGPHLHFEIWRGGPDHRPNPLDVVRKAAPP